MKLEDMILVVENRKGTETNFLMDLTDYMGEVLRLWGDGYVVENIAESINELYGKKRKRRTGMICILRQTRVSTHHFVGVNRS